MLVHSELINKTPGDIRGCVRCGDRRCRVCDFLGEGTNFKINVTDKNFVINFNLNCNSDHVVYLLSYARCAIHYVGSTITKSGLELINISRDPMHIGGCQRRTNLGMNLCTGTFITQTTRALMMSAYSEIS